MDVSPERFEELVVDALDAIPEDLGTEMENVAVFIEEWPTAEQLDGRSGTLFGLYEGVSLTRRSRSTTRARCRIASRSSAARSAGRHAAKTSCATW